MAINGKSAILEKLKGVFEMSSYRTRTKEIYYDWIFRFLSFQKGRDLQKLNVDDAKHFIEFLVREKGVSSSVLNQAFAAILFLYKEIYRCSDPGLYFLKPKSMEKKLPVILKRNEVKEIFSLLKGEYLLIASLMYGSGLKLKECLHLRVGDVSFYDHTLRIRNQDNIPVRSSLLPKILISDIQRQILKVKIKLEENLLLKEFSGSYSGAESNEPPFWAKELYWQYLFPSKTLRNLSGQLMQAPLDESLFRKVIKQSMKKARLPENASTASLRHSFAVHLMEDGYDAKVIQRLLGHKSLKSTMVYSGMATKEKLRVKSPIDW